MIARTHHREVCPRKAGFARGCAIEPGGEVVEGLPEARGQTYRLPGGSFFDLRDGKIARVTTYYNLADWMAQVK